MRDRVLDRRLADQHRLEAALERGVLLDVLAVLVERRGADGAQLAARQHRLQQVGGVDRALGGAGADDRVQLVDEQDDLALGGDDLGQHGLQPLLELAAELGAGQQRADVERPRRGGPSGVSGTSPETMRWARPSTIAVLPTPGSPISTGLFFVRRHSTWTTRRISSSRPITGSSLPASARAVRSRANLRERAVAVLGVLVGDALAAAHAAQRLEQVLLRRALRLQQLAGAAALLGERDQQVLGGDELVGELLRLHLGPVEHGAEAEARLRRASWRRWRAAASRGRPRRPGAAPRRRRRPRPAACRRRSRTPPRGRAAGGWRSARDCRQSARARRRPGRLPGP